MTISDPTRIYRKIKKSGWINTVSTGWESIYAEALLKKYFLELLSFKDDRVIFREQLRDMAVNRYDIFQELEQNNTIPVRGKIPASHSFDTVKNRALSEPSIFEFSSGHILSPCGLGITNNGGFITDSVGLPSEARPRVATSLAKSASRNGFWWTRRQVLDPDQLDNKKGAHIDTACSLIPIWSNYYHWMIECLPRLRSIEQYRKATGNDPTIMVPPNRPSWMDEWLTLLDIKESCRDLNEKIISVDKLIIPTHPEPTYNDCAWLRNQVFDRLDKNTEATRRIFISRSDATDRRIVNMEQIQSVLSDFRIKQYVLSELSIQEQAQLFAEAELVVSPHGAGLANLVFSDDTTIIELFSSKKSTSYYRLSQINDLNYYFLTSQQDGVDIRVDPDGLRHLLNNTSTLL